MHRTADIGEPLVKESHHQLAIELPPEPIAPDAHPTRFTQVSQNLVTNAGKYTDRGGRITIRAVLEGAEVAVAVYDTGAGIPREMWPDAAVGADGTATRPTQRTHRAVHSPHVTPELGAGRAAGHSA